MKNEQIKLLDIQIIASILFIVSIFISIYLANDEKNNILKKASLNNKTAYNINLINRIFVLLLSLVFLYVNYQNYLNDNSKKGLKGQLIANILTVIAAIIVIYITIEGTNNNLNIADIENPII